MSPLDSPVGYNPLPDEIAQFESGIIFVRPYWQARRPYLLGTGVVIDETLFLKTTGRIPQGMGRWSFQIGEYVLAGDVRCPYEIACIAAREIADAHGIEQIEVLPV